MIMTSILTNYFRLTADDNDDDEGDDNHDDEGDE